MPGAKIRWLDSLMKQSIKFDEPTSTWCWKPTIHPKWLIFLKCPTARIVLQNVSANAGSSSLAVSPVGLEEVARVKTMKSLANVNEEWRRMKKNQEELRSIKNEEPSVYSFPLLFSKFTSIIHWPYINRTYSTNTIQFCIHWYSLIILYQI